MIDDSHIEWRFFTKPHQVETIMKATETVIKTWLSLFKPLLHKYFLGDYS